MNKPSVLIIQEAGRHAGNFMYRESLCLQRAFKQYGVNSYVWGKGFDTYAVPIEQLIDEYEYILLLEQYDTHGWIPQLKNIAKPVVLWSIDTHICGELHLKKYVDRHAPDMIFTSVKSHEANNVKWLPNAYPNDLFMPHSENVKRDVVFGYCGSPGSKDRKKQIKMLEEQCELKTYYNIIGDDMVKTLSSFNISFNYNVCDDINYRTFESAAAGAAVLTNRTTGIDLLFEDGKSIILYENENDCMKKANMLINDRKMCRKIGRAGQEIAKENHTYDNRAREITETAERMLY